MDHTTMLTHVLKLHFGWHLARIKCLSCLIVASFQVKTVNFVELATAFSGSAKVDSHYRRIQRFFKEIQLQQDAIARFVVSLLPYDQFVLSMDSSFYPWTVRFIHGPHQLDARMLCDQFCRPLRRPSEDSFSFVLDTASQERKFPYEGTNSTHEPVAQRLWHSTHSLSDRQPRIHR